MPMITATVNGLNGAADNAPWLFGSDLRIEPNVTGKMVSTTRFKVTPDNGYFTTYMTPGPAWALHRGVRYEFTVPDTDAYLGDLLFPAE